MAKKVHSLVIALENSYKCDLAIEAVINLVRLPTPIKYQNL